MRDQVPHPYKTADKIIILYILIFRAIKDHEVIGGKHFPKFTLLLSASFVVIVPKYLERNYSYAVTCQTIKVM
jgi:hypothetical protein